MYVFFFVHLVLAIKRFQNFNVVGRKVNFRVPSNEPRVPNATYGYWVCEKFPKSEKSWSSRMCRPSKIFKLRKKLTKNHSSLHFYKPPLIRDQFGFRFQSGIVVMDDNDDVRRRTSTNPNRRGRQEKSKCQFDHSVRIRTTKCTVIGKKVKHKNEQQIYDKFRSFHPSFPVKIFADSFVEFCR